MFKCSHKIFDEMEYNQKWSIPCIEEEPWNNWCLIFFIVYILQLLYKGDITYNLFVVNYKRNCKDSNHIIIILSKFFEIETNHMQRFSVIFSIDYSIRIIWWFARKYQIMDSWPPTSSMLSWPNIPRKKWILLGQLVPVWP